MFGFQEIQHLQIGVKFRSGLFFSHVASQIHCHEVRLASWKKRKIQSSRGPKINDFWWIVDDTRICCNGQKHVIFAEENRLLRNASGLVASGFTSWVQVELALAAAPGTYKYTKYTCSFIFWCNIFWLLSVCLILGSWVRVHCSNRHFGSLPAPAGDVRDPRLHTVPLPQSAHLADVTWPSSFLQGMWTTLGVDHEKSKRLDLGCCCCLLFFFLRGCNFQPKKLWKSAQKKTTHYW